MKTFFRIAQLAPVLLWGIPKSLWGDAVLLTKLLAARIIFQFMEIKQHRGPRPHQRAVFQHFSGPCTRDAVFQELWLAPLFLEGGVEWSITPRQKSEFLGSPSRLWRSPGYMIFSHLSFSGEALCRALGLVVKWKFLKDGQVEMGFRPTLQGSENRTETKKTASDAKGT